MSTLTTSHGSALYYDMQVAVEQGRLPVVVPVAPEVVYLQTFTLNESCVLLEDDRRARDEALTVVVLYVHQELRRSGS